MLATKRQQRPPLPLLQPPCMTTAMRTGKRVRRWRRRRPSLPRTCWLAGSPTTYIRYSLVFFGRSPPGAKPLVSSN